MDVQLGRLRCAIFCRPAARPTPREPLRPPASGPQGHRGCSVFRTKSENPVAAPQTRCKPGRGLNAGGQGRCPAGRGVESAKIATSARRIRSFPYPRKKFGTSESCPHFRALRTAHAACNYGRKASLSRLKRDLTDLADKRPLAIPRCGRAMLGEVITPLAYETGLPASSSSASVTEAPCPAPDFPASPRRQRLALPSERRI